MEFKVDTKKAYSHTMCYVARYTRRFPIAKSRIIKWDNESKMVTWRHKPHNQPEPVDTTMHVHKFIDKK